jgi:hypothetical protein
MVSGTLAGPGVASTSGAPFEAAWTTRAGYVNFERTGPGGLSFESGMRLSDSTLVGEPAATPWIRGAWRFTSQWTLSAAVGASRQFPPLEVITPVPGSDLVAERATHIDLGVEQRLSALVWQATLFDRVENGILRGLGFEPALNEGISGNSAQNRYSNALSGLSRGIELVVIPHGTGRLSGWMSYAYAVARQSDHSTGETFWSDFDRRHAFNATGVWRIGQQSSVSVTVRGASGTPIPGYFDVNSGNLFAGTGRNDVRLPAYVRVDGRVQRTFFASRRAVTLFGEVINAVNRRNEGPTQGSIDPVTGEAIGFSRPLIPRRVSIGVDVRLFPF